MNDHELLAIEEISELCGLSESGIVGLIHLQEFPLPINVPSEGFLLEKWMRPEVEQWIKRNK